MSVYALDPKTFEFFKVEPNVLPPTATTVVSMIAEHMGFRESYLECYDLHDVFHKTVAAVATPQCKSFFLIAKAYDFEVFEECQNIER
jgi:hypothetical protein